jgi:hypothetical protein
MAEMKMGPFGAVASKTESAAEPGAKSKVSSGNAEEQESGVF